MSDSSRKYIVYKHINKINGKVYIGQTCMKPEHRWRNGNGYINNSYFYNAIQKYGWDNFEHVIVAKNLTQSEANNIEERLIKECQSTDRNNGYNIMFGGDNHSLSDETKEKLSKIAKERMGSYTQEELENIGRKISVALSGENNGFYGKKHTEETKQKMRDNHANFSGENHPMYGHKHSDATKAEWSKKRKGKNLYADNPNAKQVIQYDKNMNYISTFLTIKEAAEITGCSHSNISSCCRGRIKSSGGYKWRYANECNEQLCCVSSA